MSKLRIAGAWSGSLDVDLEHWTVTMLRDEIAKKAGPGAINLIFGGKVLKDEDGVKSLGELGLKNNSKVLASRASSADQGKELVAEEERDKRLSRIKYNSFYLSGFVYEFVGGKKFESLVTWV